MKTDVSRFAWGIDDVIVTRKRRLASRAETVVHAATNAHLPKIEVAIRHAFAMGRRALGTPPNADRAANAVGDALKKTLRPTLLKAMVAGGEAGVEQLRTLGDVEGHPFHGNQWTTGYGGTELTNAGHETVSKWESADATFYDDMRNPKTALGKQTTAMLEQMPVHDGVHYRGLSLSSKDLGKLTDAKGVKMKLHSSASKEEGVAKNFMDVAHENMPDERPVLIEFHGRAADISDHLSRDYKATKEVVAKAGTVYRFKRLTHEQGYTRITLEEKR